MNGFIFLTITFFHNVLNAKTLLPGLGFVARGYNPYTGNPQQQQTGHNDPGYSEPIFNFSNLVHEVNGYYYPNGVSISQESICSENSSFSCYEDVITYQKSMSVGVSATVPIPSAGAIFSASNSFSTVYKSTQNKEHVYASTKTTCSVYLVSLNAPNNLPPFTGNFKTEISKMPTAYNSNTQNYFLTFFEDFGSHYIVKGELGGIYGNNFEMDYYKYSSYSSSQNNFQLSAKALCDKNFGVALNSSSEKTQAEDLSKSTVNTMKYNIGGIIPSSGSISQWYNSLKSHAALISFRYAPIYNLLTSQYFPKDSNISKKKSALYNALVAYCGHLQHNNGNVKCNGAYPNNPKPPLPIFQGVYTTPNVMNNPYNGRQGCNSGYSPIKYFGAGYQAWDFFICYQTNQLHAQHDNAGAIGGSYFTRNSACSAGNVLHNNACSCPSGFHAAEALKFCDKEHNWYTTYFCYPSTSVQDTTGRVILGGFYQTGHIPVGNYLANNQQTCPGGFTAHQLSNGQFTCDAAVSSGKCYGYVCIADDQFYGD